MAEQDKKQLQRLLMKTGLRQNEIAEKLGTTESRVSRWALGYHTPAPKSLVEVYELLREHNVEIDFLELFKIVNDLN